MIWRRVLIAACLAVLIAAAVGTHWLAPERGLPYDRAADNGLTFIRGLIAIGILWLLAGALKEV